MKSNLTSHTPISAKQLQETKQNLNALVNKKTQITILEKNKKIATMSANIISVSSNIFSAKVELNGNSGKIMRSFPICDILTGKLVIEELN